MSLSPDFILYHVLINALLILFIHGITCEGFPFYFVRKWLDKLWVDECGTAKWYYYPILYCVYCMSSIYGLAYFFIVIYQAPFSLDQIGYAILHLALLWSVVRFLYDTQNS